MTRGTRAAVLISASLLAAAGCGGGSDADQGQGVSRSTHGVVACEAVDAASTLDPFYEKCRLRDGLLFAAAGEVPDAALDEMVRILDAMTAARPDVRTALADAGIYTVVLGANQLTTDIPEYAYLADEPGTDWNTRARGFGSVGPGKPTLVAEEDLLCYENDVWHEESVAVHEFAHTFFDQGIRAGSDRAKYQEQLTNAYEAAMAAGLWKDTYAAENESEYWAVGVQLYFDSIARFEIQGRDALVAYDPALADLIAELMPEDWTYACPAP